MALNNNNNNPPPAMEGLGAPITTHLPSSHKHDHSDDPTLQACCQRELEGNRRYNAIQSTLRTHDRVAITERQRRGGPMGGMGAGKQHLLQRMDFGLGCRCCYDPKLDGGGDYEALGDERDRIRRRMEEEEEEEGAAEEEQDDDDDEKIIKTRATISTAGDDDDDSNDESDDDDSEFDYLLDDDEIPPSSHEAQRLEELHALALYHENVIQHGYGVHRQHSPLTVLRTVCGLGLTSNGGRNDSTAAAAEAVVMHLYEPTSHRSAKLDILLESHSQFASRYKGTKFVRSPGRSVLNLNDETFLRKELGNISWEKDLPCLVAIRDGVVIAYRPNLSGFFPTSSSGSGGGGSRGRQDDEEIEANAVHQFLDQAGVLIERSPPMEYLCRIKPEEDALIATMLAMKVGGGETEEQEQRYDCGMDGCHKPFFHEHVGVKTEKQSGLVWKEDEE